MPERDQLRRIEAALRVATEAFAAELNSPSDRAPPWDPFEWTMAMAAAVLHGVSPLLATTLRWQDAPQWQRFLSEQHRHTAARQRRMIDLLNRIDEAARSRDVPFVALKGCALHGLGLYACGQRPMADIDLLVPKQALESLSAVLRTLDFHATASIGRHILFEPRASNASSYACADPPFGEHENAPLKIEVHTHLSERLALAEPDITEQVMARDLAPGLNAYPTRVALMAHLLLHAAGNIVGRALRLIHLHDIALLSAQLSAQEWERLLELRVSGRPIWWAIPALQLLDRYYPGRVPGQVLTALARSCPRALTRLSREQHLSDVSYAAIRRVALPALRWTGSWFERLEYMRSRLIPGTQQRAIYRLVSSEPWAEANRWNEVGHLHRLLWHALKRPPRLQPMYVVNAAIAAARF
jgi:hypothetical protein